MSGGAERACTYKIAARKWSILQDHPLQKWAEAFNHTNHIIAKLYLVFRFSFGPIFNLYECFRGKIKVVLDACMTLAKI